MQGFTHQSHNKHNTTSSLERFLIRPPKAQACLRLFCFPYAGGGASAFHNWAKHLPPEIDSCPIQLPGREDRIREKPHTTLPALIDALLNALLPYIETPFAFFGHSMGAIIAFELARQLRRRSLPGPTRLFVSAHRAPQIPDPDPRIYSLPEAEFITTLRQLQGTPDEVLQNPELLELFVPILRADFELIETYRYRAEASLACPISVFGGLQDSKITRTDLEAWREQTSQACVLRMFAGNHFFLHSVQTMLLHTIAQDLFRDFQADSRLPNKVK
ncbi:thioesterase [Ktedonobacter sp. SOSP1-85]|uniref:thioesterase II family protein n=1 Tax=Ktedonobacter sp. SOSP1-85 TaxID=2778367 RepID=UPI0019166D1C|nr:thioesterase II family protein [Ktedonobacter sp. SOSP1-85]GHO80015.1 thioesterase [Ktedonobacter sp. SOSP1-85]